MTNLWLGDLRVAQLQYWQSILDKQEIAEKEKKAKEKEKKNKDKSEEDESEDTAVITVQNENFFITDDMADISWLESVAVQELAAVTATTNAIFMLGLNDCLESCTWKSLDIKKIANTYVETLKTISEQFTNFKIYICSVNPVDAACPGISYKGELISAKALNKKIEIFNSILKDNCLDDGTSFYFDSKKDEKTSEEANKCNAVFVDCYDYFVNTSFTNRDGIRYSQETSLYVLDFVKSYLRVASGTAFTPRKEEPDRDNTYYYEDNVYYQSGCGIPNCTAYAWGRFFEILGEKPTLFTQGDAETMFGGSNTYYSDYETAAENGTKKDGYSRGKEPQLGAIICWENTSNGWGNGGHVAVVEEIVDNTTIKISESASGGFSTGNPNFHYSTINKSGDAWTYSSNYKFQGFIYNPKATGSGSTGASGDYVSKSQVTSSNEYLGYDKWIDGDAYNSVPGKEMKLNARYIWQYLGSRGWTLNAVAGILGNMETESHINPGMWQDGRVRGDPTSHGYSLVQWTPYTKYTEWCEERNLEPSDMDSALERIVWELENDQQYGKTSEYPLTFKEFSTSTKEAYWLGGAFLINYERPNEKYRDPVTRGNQAKRWYEYLLPFSPFMAAPMSLVNLKIDKFEPTKIQGSFVVRNGEVGSCKLFTSNGKIVLETRKYTKKDLTGIDESKKDGQKAKSTDITKIINFSFSGLTPNSKYKILVEISKEDKSDTLESEVFFKTPQAYPDKVTNLELLTADSKFPTETFKLNCLPINDWGYWKKNSFGYDVLLIINGKCKQEKTVPKLSKTSNIKISDYFGTSKLKLSDTIQIGIRAWTTDDSGKKIFNKEISTTNSICMLTQPFITYLNTDKYK